MCVSVITCLARLCVLSCYTPATFCFVTICKLSVSLLFSLWGSTTSKGSFKKCLFHTVNKSIAEKTHTHTHMDGRTVFSENTPSILSQQDSKAPENKETITLLYYSDTGIYSCQSTTSLRQGKGEEVKKESVFLWKTLLWVGVCAARNR